MPRLGYEKMFGCFFVNSSFCTPGGAAQQAQFVLHVWIHAGPWLTMHSDNGFSKHADVYCHMYTLGCLCQGTVTNRWSPPAKVEAFNDCIDYANTEPFSPNAIADYAYPLLDPFLPDRNSGIRKFEKLVPFAFAIGYDVWKRDGAVRVVRVWGCGARGVPAL